MKESVLSGRVHRISLEIPFKIESVNVHLIDDDGFLVLIDAGPNGNLSYEKLRTEIQELGYSLADINEVIITHAHVDHFGLAWRIKEESKCKVRVHRQDAPWLLNFPAEWERRMQGLRVTFKEAGVPEEILREHLRILDKVKVLGENVDMDGLLDNGEVLKFNNFLFKIVHCPGHFPGCICLFEEKEKVLFSGDNLMKDRIPGVSLNFLIGEKSGYKRYEGMRYLLNSLSYLKSMEIDVVFPGHGAAIYGRNDIVTEIDNTIFELRDKIIKVVNSLRYGLMNAWDICLHVYEAVLPHELLAKMGMVLSCLDLLEYEGRVKHDVKDGTLFYSENTLTKKEK